MAAITYRRATGLLERVRSEQQHANSMWNVLTKYLSEWVEGHKSGASVEEVSDGLIPFIVGPYKHGVVTVSAEDGTVVVSGSAGRLFTVFVRDGEMYRVQREGYNHEPVLEVRDVDDSSRMVSGGDIVATWNTNTTNLMSGAEDTLGGEDLYLSVYQTPNSDGEYDVVFTSPWDHTGDNESVFSFPRAMISTAPRITSEETASLLVRTLGRAQYAKMMWESFTEFVRMVFVDQPDEVQLPVWLSRFLYCEPDQRVTFLYTEAGVVGFAGDTRLFLIIVDEATHEVLTVHARDGPDPDDLMELDLLDGRLCVEGSGYYVVLNRATNLLVRGEDMDDDGLSFSIDPVENFLGGHDVTVVRGEADGNPYVFSFSRSRFSLDRSRRLM